MSSTPTPVSRRVLFAGAGTASVLAAAASLSPALKPQQAVQAQPLPKPERGGGYTLTARIEQYYQTARI
ncbi:MAG: hypothetical protein OHK0048_14340 [Rhodoferax sp.]